LFLPSPTICGNSVAEEKISLDVKNQPLGDVLEEISAETGYEFNIDESWTNLPVTASIKNEPLHVGLKRILRNFNNAVIYGSDGTIKIKIYDREKSSGQSALNRSYEETVRQPDISENPRTLPPGFAPRDRKRQSQTEENAAEESSESEPEPDEANDNEEATEDKEEEQSNAADEEVATDSESKSAEDTSTEDGAEAAETGAASESDSDTGAAGNE
jgi:hypothetical protein